MKKGIILAGGSGSRLRPLTDFVCKQLLPVYDKPMIHYPLSTLILLGITEILIISTPRDTPVLEQALGDGKNLGISLTYAVQESPNGLAEAFLIGQDFIGDDNVCLMLGDNILHIAHIFNYFKECKDLEEGAWIVGVPVINPDAFGVIEMNEHKQVISLEEKPERPKSNLAAIGLYFYDNSVVEKAKSLVPSSRGELEITDLNNLYLSEKKLKSKILSRGATWLDAGTFEALSDAATFVEIVETRLGLKIGCIEEAAYMQGRISGVQLQGLAQKYAKSPYGTYLNTVAGMAN